MATSGGPLIRDDRPDDARILRRTRFRLMLVSGFVTLVILVVLGAALYTAVASSLEAAGQQKVQARAEDVHAAIDRLTGATAGNVLPEQRDVDIAFGGPSAGTWAYVVAPDGRWSGPAFPNTPAQFTSGTAVTLARSGKSGFLTYEIGETSYRVYYEPYLNAGRVFAIEGVADRTSEVQLLDTLRLVLIGGGLLALLGALAAGYLYAGRALVPIRDSIERRRLALQRQREFTANASHELRTPLTVIRASVEDLRRNRRARVEDVGEALEDIDAEVNHLTALVEDLLFLARTDSGVVQVERRPVDLADTAAEAVSLLAPLAERQHVSVVLDPLPAPLLGDPLRLRQLVTILVDNAVRHSPQGSQVMVRVRAEGDDASLVVEDQGPGIRPEDMPRIFERFWRADNAPAGGTGLGLAIARWIVEQHGGAISVANREEGGARFIVHLPSEETGENASLEPEPPSPAALWSPDMRFDPDRLAGAGSGSGDRADGADADTPETGEHAESAEDAETPVRTR